MEVDECGRAGGERDLCAADRYAAGLQRKCWDGGDSVAQHWRDQCSIWRCAGGHGRSERCLRLVLWQRASAICGWRPHLDADSKFAGWRGGQPLFSGLGFAGFAWSSTTPGTVVAAVSQAAEGVLVNAPDATNSVMGLYYSTDAGVTWQMSTIMDGSQVVQTPLPSGGDLGGRAATAVVWNPVRQRFYAAIRYHGYYESADGVTWTRLAHQPGTGLTTTACPRTGHDGQRGVPDLSRGAGGAADDGRYVCADGGWEQSRPGAVAGCLCAVGDELRQYDRYVRQAAAIGAAGDWQWQHCDCAGGLQSCAGGGGRMARRRTRCCMRGRSIFIAARLLRGVCCGTRRMR